MHETIIHLGLVHLAIQNPLDGILPDFSILGVQFNALWKKLIAGIWALAIIVSIVFLILGILSMGKGSASGNPQQHKEGQKQAAISGIVLGCLAALGVIVGAILAIFQ